MTLPPEITEFVEALPVDLNAAVVLGMLAFSLVASVFALVRNRPALTSSEGEEEADLGVLFDNPRSILPHLNELRDRVIQALLAIVAAAVLSSAMIRPILDVLTRPLGGIDRIGEELSIFGVTEQVQVWFRISITFGLILAAPYIIAQVWIFVAAGLKRKERRLFYTLFPFAVLLFGSGVAFAYFAMLPVAIPFLTDFLFEATPTLESYIDFVTTVLLFVGLSFELPMFVFLLAKAGVVNHKMLIKNWRIAIVLIAVVSALVTPTPDPINMGLMSLPLILLYGLSIILARFA